MSKTKLLSGHEAVPLTLEEQKEIMEAGMVFPCAMMRLQPDGWLLPDPTVTKYCDKVYNFKFRPDDLVVMSYPKSGTTWMQEILWTMVHNPDLNHPETNTPILNRSPDISFDFIFDSQVTQFLKFEAFRKWFTEVCPDRRTEDGIMLQITELMSGRRIIKSHLPVSLMAPDFLDKAKVVYMIRNPKDVIVSYYNMMMKTNVGEFSPAFESFTRGFMQDNFIFGPYWRHVQDAWEQRDHPNMRIVFYEELKADTMTHLQRLNDFTGADLTQSQLDAVERHTSFSSMKGRGEPMKDGLFTNFFRKGTSGGWKSHFTPELEQEMDEWIEKHTTNNGMNFKVE
uniref:Sulfotransferase domain-containing protein n=1 Tax=Scylla olivacea TaxID=85551 RepID=A0A0P4W676_SCYOL